MRELNDREKRLLDVLTGVGKSAISSIPVLGQALAGWDSYKQGVFNRNVKSMISHLAEKVEDIEKFLNDDYFKTNEGERFARKVLDAALDNQLEDKQELFINALINAPTSPQVDELMKLKFADILRHLSRAALMILAEMHKMFASQVRGPGREVDSTTALPYVDAGKIAQKLSTKYEPYLVTSAIHEMESQGLFSNTGEWRKDMTTGGYMPGIGFNTAMSYTDFAAKFVEFISAKNIVK